jgi:hypothetical protein
VLAGLLLVGRPIKKSDVLAPAALLTGVTIDVLAGKICERLRPTFGDLPLTWVLAFADVA